jgi:hypothetical protein
MRVTDHTPGFAFRERIPPPPPLSDRGRGLFLIQSAMDEVKYLRGAGENTLVMRMRRAGTPATASSADSVPHAGSPAVSAAASRPARLAPAGS